MKKINYKYPLYGIPLALIWVFFGPMLVGGYFNLEPEWRKFISILGFSIIGVVIFVLRRYPGVNQHLMDSWGMLLIGIGPTVASFDLLPKDDFGRMLMPVFTFCVIVFWFLYFGFFIKPNKYSEPEKIKKEQLQIKETRLMTFVVFGFLAIIGLALFQGILKINEIL